MTMPLNLVLVRHGQSEGNKASHASREGDNSHFTEALRQRHSYSWRLTDKGIDQAKIAGRWIRENLNFSFDRFYTSEYIRAQETAGYLQLPNARWYLDSYLRERDWGEMDVIPENERQEKFADFIRKRKVETYYWKPPNGESIADLCLRIDRVLNTLHRECSDKNVIIVCHGEVMEAFRIRLERLTQQRFAQIDTSAHPHDKIHNCQVLHYTRTDPLTGHQLQHFNWMRSICPTDLSLSSNDWQSITRPSFSNEELLIRVGSVERMIS